MIPFPDEKFKILYIDPPWRYRNATTGGSMVSGSKDKYDTMSLKELQELPIDQIRDKNSIMFMWAVFPMLREALELMEDHWKFRYVTSVIWHKTNILGMGYWFRGNCELCLVGQHGQVPAFRCQKENFIEAPVRGHSKKPREMREMIDNIAKENDLNPKIELFSRDKIEGWTVWGNQIPTSEQKRLRT
jgi:N6-adenosine-specific RNA methylase IME4